MAKRQRERTTTNLVLAFIREKDDFLKEKDIIPEMMALLRSEFPDVKPNVMRQRIYAALSSLKRYKCVAVLDEHYYPLPKETDTRSKVFLERAAEEKPRKRKPRKPKEI